jgi:hypothetical protein
MTNYDIVKKLVGHINPIGCSNKDEERFENLKEMCKLINQLICDIDYNIDNNLHAKEYSVKNNIDYCIDFMKDLKRRHE